MENCEAMTSSTHSFAYSYGLVKKCFLKICETSKFHNFLIFQPIFIRFSLFCSENFTLSSEIKLDQLRTSPLKTLSLLGPFQVLIYPFIFKSDTYTIIRFTKTVLKEIIKIFVMWKTLALRQRKPISFLSDE